MILGVGASFLICLFWICILSFGYCFHSGYSENGMAVFYLIFLVCLSGVFTGNLVNKVCFLRLEGVFLWLSWCIYSQGKPAGAGGWETRGRKTGVEDHCDLLGMGSERKGTHEQLSCYNARDGARALNFRSRRKGVGPPLAYFWSEVLNPIGVGVTGGCEEPNMTSGKWIRSSNNSTCSYLLSHLSWPMQYIPL